MRRIASCLLGLMLLILLSGCGGPYVLRQPSLQADGGTRLTFQAACFADQPSCDLIKGRDAAVAILQRRLQVITAYNTAKADGFHDIVVELPGQTDTSDLIPVLTDIGGVQFLDTGETSLAVGTEVTGKTCGTDCQPGQYHVLFTESDLDPNSVQAGLDPQGNQPIVHFAFAGGARQRFADYTRQHIGQYLTIAASSKIVESATIQSPIDGPVQITSGDGSTAWANHLAAVLASPALPVTLTLTTSEGVTPSAQ